eukprot:601724-Alexandrium_andersonii.AAC.1
MSHVPPATINQPVGLHVRSCSEDPMWSTRLIADIGGPTTFLARRPGAHVFIEIGFGCTNIEILCEDVRLRASMVRGAGLV